MKLIVVRFAVMAALSACLSVNGEHTDNEKMDVARTCLLRAMQFMQEGFVTESLTMVLILIRGVVFWDNVIKNGRSQRNRRLLTYT